MSSQSLQRTVSQSAQTCGFHLAGITPVFNASSGEFRPSELAHFSEWIDAGRGGEMEYLKRRDADGRLLRSSVRIPFPWVRSVIVCAVNYNSDQPYSIDPPDPEIKDAAWIARYAWSGRRREDSGQQSWAPTDYHHVLRGRLEQLRSALQETLGEFQARCFVDTGPLVERVYAKYAGLGWLAKNTCLIHESLGSWLFLGVILTSLELPLDEWTQPRPDRCGSCTRCLDACPTQALTPYVMDATRCIAYLTIEKRGAIPEEFAEQVGRNIFGCDICQEVCPWNNRAGNRPPISDWPELQPRPELVNPALDWLTALGEEGYRSEFRGSPLERAKVSGLERNLANARNNFIKNNERRDHERNGASA